MTSKPARRPPYATIIALVVVGAYYIFNEDPGTAPSPPTRSSIETLFDERFDGSMIESAGIVERVLPDDTDGSRHQRFILKLDNGQTLLVAHNIDLASRLEGLKRGATVKFRGQYEVNDRGGVVHWTHHDPRDERPGGWLEYNGKRYR